MCIFTDDCICGSKGLISLPVSFLWAFSIVWI
jgi:hypothetical protein